MRSITILAIYYLALGAEGKPSQSQLAETVSDVRSSSAPAYWSAECGDRTYVGSYTLMMDWAECRDYCQYFPHAGELGHSFGFADILDSDTMECLRFNMLEQYTPGNGYAGHYWAGGYRGEDGQYRWDSGAPFSFDDFIGNPGAEPYVHLTPGNNYAWNTKSDQNDRNNGCLCKSQETVQEKKVKESGCPEGWGELDNRCILILKPEEYPNFYEVNAMEWCQAQGWDGLVEWSSYGEFIQLLILKHSHNINYSDNLDGGRYGNLPTYVGLFDNNLNETCDHGNIPDWQFYSGRAWTEALEMGYNKYWENGMNHHNGVNCWEDQVFFYGPGGPGSPLSRALLATDNLIIGDWPEGVPLCQKLK